MKTITKYITTGALFISISNLLFANEVNKNDNYITFFEEKKSDCTASSKELLQEAILNHPSVKMSQAMLDGAKQQVEFSKWGYYPSPTVDYSVKDSNKTQTLFRLEQPIWTGGKLDGELSKSKNKEQEAYFMHEEKKYKFISNYMENVKKYLVNQEKIETLKDNQKKLREMKKLVLTMVQTGELSASDENNINARLAALSAEIIITQANLKAATASIELLLNKKLDCNINYDHVISANSVIDIYKSIEDLLSKHPSLMSLDMKVKYTVDDIDLAKANMWPTLVLRAEHKRGTIYDESEPESENLVYFNFNASTGAGLSGLNAIEKAKIEVAKVKSERIVKEQELTDAFMKNYTNYIMTKSNLDILKRDLELASKVYESNYRLFTSGRKTWVEVISSLNELKTKKIKYDETRVDKDILGFKLDLDTGRINLNTGEYVGI